MTKAALRTELTEVIKDITNSERIETLLNNIINELPEPAEYKSYIALLTQSGANPPVATVLGINTLGNIVWTYNATGDYVGTLAGAFTDKKTTIIMGVNNLILAAGDSGEYVYFRNDVNSIGINTIINGALADGELYDSVIEVRVYN